MIQFDHIDQLLLMMTLTQTALLLLLLLFYSAVMRQRLKGIFYACFLSLKTITIFTQLIVNVV